jgi:dGTPase
MPTAEDARTVEIVPNYEDEVRFLKQLTRCYVIDNTALAAQQFGQRRLLREVFGSLIEAVNDGKYRNVLPPRFRHHLAHETDKGEQAVAKNVRVVADTVASLTEDELVALHKRLTGASWGLVTNQIVL